MTTFEEMTQIMKANGWEQIIKKSEYEKIKRENKQMTARIGWTYFKLKEALSSNLVRTQDSCSWNNGSNPFGAIKFTSDELYWIERQADIERSKCLNTFNLICDIHKIDKKLAQKYTDEMIKLNTFLLTLIAKLEAKRK